MSDALTAYRALEQRWWNHLQREDLPHDEWERTEREYAAEVERAWQARTDEERRTEVEENPRAPARLEDHELHLADILRRRD